MVKLNYFSVFLILPLHTLTLVTLTLLFTGQVGAHWLWASVIGWILIVGLGTAIGFHKLLSHRSFKTHKNIERALTYLGCLGLTGAPLYYVSIHQGYHHPFSDLEGDLHSPKDGLWHAYMGWQFKITAKDINIRHGVRILKDPVIRFLNEYYLFISWGTFLILCCIDYRIALFGMILPAFFGYHIENIVTSFGHKKWFGYKNYDLSDESVNNWILGLFSWGNGLQNNHHKYPNRYKMNHRWFEVDLSVPLVRLLERKK